VDVVRSLRLPDAAAVRFILPQPEIGDGEHGHSDAACDVELLEGGGTISPVSPLGGARRRAGGARDQRGVDERIARGLLGAA
jgi:hypothetical protein